VKPNTEAKNIDIAGPHDPLVIDWEDGHHTALELEYLRRMCPCAECTQHGATPLAERLSRPLPSKALEVKSIEEVGNYALQIKWGDEHDTGLYSFHFLRNICACQQCKPVENWEV